MTRTLIELAIALGLLASFGACTASSRPEGSRAVEVPVAARSAPPARPDERRGAPDACARLRTHQTKSIAAAIAEAKRAGNGKEPNGDPLPENEVGARLDHELGRCEVSGSGAWGLVVQRLSPMPWDGWGGVQVLFALVHVGDDGARTQVTPFDDAPDGGAAPKVDNLYFSNVDGAEIRSFTAFDYDGDGTREIVLVVSGKYHEGETWAWGRVYTVAKGGVAPYPPAASVPFSSVVDEDADGRPDLLGGEPYDDVFENCCSGFASQLEGPPLLAHALTDGSFSRTDGVAIAVAKRACPEPPKEIVAGGAAWDVGAVHTAVACAKLWGVDDAKILGAIDKAFGTGSKSRPSKPKAGTASSAPALPDGCDMNHCTSTRETREHAQAWLAVTPPLRLR